MNASSTSQPSEDPAGQPALTDDCLDLTLLDMSLKKSVWERMLANDDALRFVNLLQAATARARAKP